MDFLLKKKTEEKNFFLVFSCSLFIQNFENTGKEKRNNQIKNRNRFLLEESIISPGFCFP